MVHLLLMTGLGLERVNINGVVIMDWYKVMVSGRDVMVTRVIGVSCVISDALNSLQCVNAQSRSETRNFAESILVVLYEDIFISHLIMVRAGQIPTVNHVTVKNILFKSEIFFIGNLTSLLRITSSS